MLFAKCYVGSNMYSPDRTFKAYNLAVPLGGDLTMMLKYTVIFGNSIHTKERQQLG